VSGGGALPGGGPRLYAASPQPRPLPRHLRAHLRRPELSAHFSAASEVIKYKKLLRLPAFVIARKQDKFWKITEKVFAEELR